MIPKSEIFEKTYNDYLAQVANVDIEAVKDILGLTIENNQIIIPFFGKNYLFSKKGIFDESGEKPSFSVCVILSKYLLLCPDTCQYDSNWVSFKDFKRSSHFLNINFFASDTEKPIATNFSGKLDLLLNACKKTGGFSPDVRLSYDLAMQFNALPRISLLMLFNDGDNEFPAQCSVLFQKQAEYYLDPESLAITAAFLANRLALFNEYRSCNDVV
ncbi:MAG: DUF3786 domain-containing protein [Desulfobacteraceae bacterium]|nr:DUF3786 domain-containing protein [Desulfobacteraceae bacterium]